MITRLLKDKLLIRASEMPVVALLGPRQSGKTTLAKAAFPQHRYISLEELDHRAFAQEDPRAFLEGCRGGAILDEIQHCPSLLSYIQTHVDEDARPGHFIVTGSQNILLNEQITQTLAGRIAILTLLPLTIAELQESKKLAQNHLEAIFFGFYPRVHAHNIDSSVWYADYLSTYIERDVRQIKQINDLMLFQKFLKLCAGRSGQLLNVSSLAADCGVSSHTATSWLSVLEASYIIFLLQPHHKNFNKRLTKMPKLYFYDTGIVCRLLGLHSALDLETHYLRGALFESMMIADLLKQCYNMHEKPNIYFWRDQSGNEIDCLLETAHDLFPIEIKAGATAQAEYFNSITKWNGFAGYSGAHGAVVYSGDEEQKRSQGYLVPWTESKMAKYSAKRQS